MILRPKARLFGLLGFWSTNTFWHVINKIALLLSYAGNINLTYIDIFSQRHLEFEWRHSCKCRQTLFRRNKSKNFKKCLGLICCVWAHEPITHTLRESRQADFFGRVAMSLDSFSTFLEEMRACIILFCPKCASFAIHISALLVFKI